MAPANGVNPLHDLPHYSGGSLCFSAAPDAPGAAAFLSPRSGGGTRRAAAAPGAHAQTGGVAIFAAWSVGVVLALWLLPPADPSDATRIRGVIWGSLIIVVGGLIDDWKELSPKGQFFIQFAAAAIAMWNLVFIELFTNPFPGFFLWETPPSPGFLLSMAT
ncbi:MAG: hypothetical protein M5U34_15580 [Chloroflexi bacterium]|nr:hypothetical protein [Chloroflexota bacterium]